MLKRVDKVFVNKTGVRPHNLAAPTVLAKGEVAVVDASFVKITGAATDDTVYIVRNMGSDDLTLPLDGASISTKELFISSPIKKGTVRSAKFIKFDPIVNQKKTIDLGTSSADAVVNTIYTLTLVYKDTKGFLQKRQNKQTFEYKAVSGDKIKDVADALVLLINADNNARVSAKTTTSNEEYLTLVAKNVATNFGLNDIDEYTQVIFDAVMTKTSPRTGGGYDAPVKFGTSGASSSLATTAAYLNAPLIGSGDWKLVRDMEKFAKSYRGLTNRTWFPIPEFNTEWSTENLKTLGASKVTLTEIAGAEAAIGPASFSFGAATESVQPSTTGMIFAPGMMVYASGFKDKNGWHRIAAAASVAATSMTQLFTGLSLAISATGTLTFYPGYEMIVIEHDTYYESPDNQQSRTAALTEILCFPLAPTGTIGTFQHTDVVTLAGHIATALGCTLTVPAVAETSLDVTLEPTLPATI